MHQHQSCFFHATCYLIKNVYMNKLVFVYSISLHNGPFRLTHVVSNYGRGLRVDVTLQFPQKE